jgi:hypothetical protein
VFHALSQLAQRFAPVRREAGFVVVDWQQKLTLVAVKTAHFDDEFAGPACDGRPTDQAGDHQPGENCREQRDRRARAAL